MDTRVKERLVGAIALVVIVVLVVPALLTGPRSRAPSSGENANTNRTVVVDLTQSEPGAPSPAAAPAVAPVAVPTPAPTPTPAPVAETRPPAEDAAPVAPPPLSSAPPAKAPDAAPTRVEPARKAEAGRTETPAPAKAAAAPAPAAEPPPDAKAAARTVPHPPKAAAAEGWVVQLGSFASRDNGEKLASTLKAKGYRAFVSEFRGSGRVLYRVRVGPEQDRARAEAIAARLGHDGYKGSVAPR